MRAQDSENSYELVPAGTELCITADVSRTRWVPRWSAAPYAVVPLKECLASRLEGLRGKVSAHVPAQSRWEGPTVCKRRKATGRVTALGAR